ncbi:MAG: hypothetical protein WCP20_05465 [Desulfuromonadales bacterium]
MTGKILVTAVTIVVSLMVSNSAFAVEKESAYSWKGFELSYPAGWKLSQEKDVPELGRVVVLSQNKQALDVTIALADKLSGDDAKKDKATPATLAMAFGMPMALKLANKNESAISISYGSVGLSDMRVLSTRFTVALPNIPDVYNIECFSTTTGSRLFVGAIQSSSKKGHVPEDNGGYRKAFQEAYHIIRSITVNGQNGSMKDQSQ